MGYFEERELLQKQREKTEQPAFMAFMDAVCKAMGEGWMRKPDPDRPDTWRVDSSFRSMLTDGETTLYFDFEKGTSFVNPSGKVNIGGSFTIPYGYMDNSLRPTSINVSLKKTPERVVSDIRNRYLERFEVFRLDAVAKFDRYQADRERSHAMATELYNIDPDAFYPVTALNEGQNDYDVDTRYNREDENSPDFRVKVQYGSIKIDIRTIDFETAKKVVALLRGK